MPLHLFTPTRLTMLLAAVVIATAGVAPAMAAAPMAKTPAPGFFRLMVGDFEITALNDGTNDLPANKILQGTTPAKVDQTLAAVYLKSPVESSYNAFLINTGSKLVLVDTGAGKLVSPTLGNLLSNLKASGYQPEQIDEVYITHMHSDHIGGLLSAGKLAFPNAIVRADKDESDYWLSQGNMDRAADARRPTFKNAMAAFTPYVAAGKYKPFDQGAQLQPGISAYESKGHTPGHSIYTVESKGQKVVMIGDLIHVAAVQFGEPTVTVSFDSDSAVALAERKKAFDAAAKEGYLLAGAHLPFPGIGHVRVNGAGYDWIPVNFTQMH